MSILSTHPPRHANPLQVKPATKADALAQALSGRKVGRGWSACCPAHDDRSPSLSICDAGDGKVLIHCHAGCDSEQVIATLRSRGLWPENGSRRFACLRSRGAARRTEPDRDEAERADAALAIWLSAKPAQGTLVETYLTSRGLNLPPLDNVRFHGGLKHPSGSIWPAMIALVTSGTDDVPLAIHRTFLSLDGTGKAPVNPQRMMLGRCRGGAVRLGTAQPDQWLAIGEGIETTLSVMQACSLPGWAALSAVGIISLVLPPEAAMVLACSDHDASGVGERSARDAAQRWSAEGRRVKIALPPEPDTDFNGILNCALAEQVGEEARHVA